MQESASEDIVGIKNLEAEFDVDLAKELAQAYLDDTLSIIDKLETALANGEREALRSAAHMLKGCSRAIQAWKIEKISAELESSARDGDFESARKHMPLVVVAYRETEAFLRNYIG